ncbi:MAG: hypothetical protein J0I36_10975, partial [Pandoraea sp.]|nr:hypothetical protein [Pandoraea sp.]
RRECRAFGPDSPSFYPVVARRAVTGLVVHAIHAFVPDSLAAVQWLARAPRECGRRSLASAKRKSPHEAGFFCVPTEIGTGKQLESA